MRAGGVCMISVDNIIMWTDIGCWILAQMVPLILTHTRRHAAAAAAGWMVSELRVPSQIIVIISYHP